MMPLVGWCGRILSSQERFHRLKYRVREDPSPGKIYSLQIPRKCVAAAVEHEDLWLSKMIPVYQQQRSFDGLLMAGIFHGNI